MIETALTVITVAGVAQELFRIGVVPVPSSTVQAVDNTRGTWTEDGSERSQEWHPRQSQHNVNKSLGKVSGDAVVLCSVVVMVVGDKSGGLPYSLRLRRTAL